MAERWTEKLLEILPRKDQQELISLQANTKLQTAPEYSQVAYLSMLTKEQAIGNYL